MWSNFDITQTSAPAPGTRPPRETERRQARASSSGWPLLARRWTGTAMLVAAWFAAWPRVDVATAAEAPAEAPAARALSFEQLFGDEVVARVNGLEIRQSQLDKAYLIYQSTMAAQGRRVSERQRPVKEAILLEELVVTHLLTNGATRMDISLAVAKAEKIEAERKSTEGAEENLNRQLKVLGLKPEEYRKRLLSQTVAESVIERELNDLIQVSDEEVTAFYAEGIDVRVRLLREEIEALRLKPDTDPKLLATLQEREQLWRSNALIRMEIPERVKVIHAVITTRRTQGDAPLSQEMVAAKRRLADDLLRRARAGEDFATLVAQHSEDRNLEKTGGVYTVSRDEPYPPEFIAACFSLEPGQISDVVTSSSGFHVIKQLERLAASRRPLADIKPEIQSFLRSQKMRRSMPDLFQRVKAGAQVEIVSVKHREILEKLEANADAAAGEEEEAETPLK